MSWLALMRWLEWAPERYDAGMRVITLGRVQITHSERCLRCGACIVPCSLDALAFEDQSGRRIEPEVIRRFKLDLMEQRKLDAS